MNKKDFIIESELGRGASGIVYNAYYLDNLNLKHKVRVKKFAPLFDVSKEDFKEAYIRNTRLRDILGIANSTIVATDYYEDETGCYIVSEYAEGETLDKQKGNLLDNVKTVKAVAEVILKYHHINLLYLDIKPCNILVLPETREHVVLFDFDSFFDLNKKNENASYSKEFSAPELEHGNISKLGTWTDVYGIGALLYYQVFGKYPKYEDQVLGAEYNLEKYSAVIRTELTEIFQKTLAAAVSYRWKDLSEVISHLQKLIGSIQLDAFKSFLINSSQTQPELDLQKYKNDILEKHYFSREEYFANIAKDTKEKINSVFSYEGSMVQEYVKLYKIKFSIVKDDVLQYLKIDNPDTEVRLKKYISEKEKSFFINIKSYLSFEEIKFMEINPASHEIEKGKLLNLSRNTKKLTDFIHGNPIDVIYKMSGEMKMNIYEKLSSVKSAVEKQINSEYIRTICSFQDIFSMFQGLFNNAEWNVNAAPVYNAVILGEVFGKRLFYRKQNESTETGYLKFYYADKAAKETILGDYIPKCLVNYVEVKSVVRPNSIYVQLCDAYEVSLYEFKADNCSFSLLEKKDYEADCQSSEVDMIETALLRLSKGEVLAADHKNNQS